MNPEDLQELVVSLTQSFKFMKDQFDIERAKNACLEEINHKYRKVLWYAAGRCEDGTFKGPHPDIYEIMERARAVIHEENTDFS